VKHLSCFVDEDMPSPASSLRIQQVHHTCAQYGPS
jgi:hypothetical protein